MNAASPASRGRVHGSRVKPGMTSNEKGSRMPAPFSSRIPAFAGMTRRGLGARFGSELGVLPLLGGHADALGAEAGFAGVHRPADLALRGLRLGGLGRRGAGFGRLVGRSLGGLGLRRRVGGGEGGDRSGGEEEGGGAGEAQRESSQHHDFLSKFSPPEGAGSAKPILPPPSRPSSGNGQGSGGPIRRSEQWIRRAR